MYLAPVLNWITGSSYSEREQVQAVASKRKPKLSKFVPVEEEEEDEEGYTYHDTCSFLRRVFREEKIYSYTNMFKKLATAIHGILLESGLVGFDPVTMTRLDRFDIPEDWSYFVNGRQFRYAYTLREIPQIGQDVVDRELFAVLKFELIPVTLTIQVSGPWSTTDSNTSQDNKYVYKTSVCYVSLGSVYCLYRNRDSTEAYHIRKLVRSQLASRLIVGLRAKAGLPGPPLVDLPSDIQMKILSLLSAKDIAKLGCVCRQLNRLCC